MKTKGSNQKITFACLTALFLAVFISSSTLAETPDALTVTRKSVSIEHVTIKTRQKYSVVKSRIESGVKRLDESHRTLLKEDKIAELREKLKSDAQPYGLMIHYVATHGDWLALEGERRNGVVYHIGNVAAAVQMTKYAFGAGLYAPLRLAVYENTEGGTTFEYDKPSSEFKQFHNQNIDATAESLDGKLFDLIKSVSE